MSELINQPKSSGWRYFLGQLSIRTVLIIPFVVLTTLAAGLTGYLSYRNGQQAIEELVFALHAEIGGRIEAHLQEYLDLPHVINGLNAEGFRIGQLTPAEPQPLETHLWRQVTQFEAVSYIYFGSEQGGIISPGRLEDGTIVIEATDNLRPGDYKVFAADAQGRRGLLLSATPGYDARIRPWYKAAIEADRPTWSEVYKYFTGDILAISASQPAYAPDALIGVVAVDLLLSQIEEFLQSLEIGKSGESFIIERSGLLIASSSNASFFSGESPNLKRVSAIESEDPHIQITTQYLVDTFGDLQNINEIHQFSFYMDGERQFAQVMPFQDGRGIDWLVTITMPESDFMAQINANNRITFFLSIIGFLIAIVVGLFTANWVVQPIININQAAKGLARGEWEQPNLPLDRTDEMGELAQSFQNMAEQMQEAFVTLQSSVEQHRSLFDDSREAIIMTRPNGEVVECNAACLRLFGYSKEEMLGLNIKQCYVDPEARLVFWLALEQQGTVENYEVKFRRKNRRIMESIVTATAQRGRGTQVVFQKIIRDVTSLKQEEQEKLRRSAIEHELAVAKEIQQSLLQPARPPWEALDAICYNQPTGDVCGDFYIYEQFSMQQAPQRRRRRAATVGQTIYTLAVGDVSSRGMPAALLMAISLASFEGIIRQAYALDKILTYMISGPYALDKFLSDLDTAINRFTVLTSQNCALVFIELTKFDDPAEPTRLRCVNAGCVMPLVRRASEVENPVIWVEAVGIPLGAGLGEEFGYQEVALDLAAGDMVVLTSNGVVEATNSSHERFGFDRLHEAVASAPYDSAESMVEYLKNTLHHFVGDTVQEDDVTIVVVKV